MYQIITSHSRYGTVTDQVRHYRNCSSRNLFWHKKQRYVCLLIRTSYQNLIPGHLRKFQRIVKEGPSIYRPSHEIFIQELPMSIPEEVSVWNTNSEHRQDLDSLMQGPLEEDFNRISTRSSHKDLYKIMQGLDAIPQDRHRRTCTGAGEDTTRSWYNNLPRASQKSFHTSLPRVKRKCDHTTLFIAIKELHFSRVFWGVVSAASLNLGMRHTLQKH